MAWAGEMEWRSDPLRKGELKRNKACIAWRSEDSHSRYIEAVVNDIVIGCLYLPNGNPWPGPNIDYKLKWFKRLTAHAKKNYGRDFP